MTRPFDEWIKVGDLCVRPGDVVAIHIERDAQHVFLRGNPTSFRLRLTPKDLADLLQHVGAHGLASLVGPKP